MNGQAPQHDKTGAAPHAGEGSALEEFPPVQLITPSTIKTYQRLIETQRRYSELRKGWQPDEPVYVSLEEVVGDFLARTDLARNSAMLYRSALLWYVRSFQDEGARELVISLMAFRPPGTVRSVRAKPNTISEGHFRELVSELGATRSVWAGRAQIWLLAGLATGLRPIEWLNAHWQDADQTVLVVRSAKGKFAPAAFLRTEQDAPSESHYAEPLIRHIPVTSKADRLNIELHLGCVNASVPLDLDEKERVAEYMKYYDYCRQSIKRACRTLWGGRHMYSLYTMRSQFSANQKAAAGVATTATLMGHSGPDSPGTASYGKANQAHSSFKGGVREKSLQTQAPGHDMRGSEDARPGAEGDRE